MKSYLEQLNPEQREAVLATEGPLLVVAGAGTGKTRTLTTRIMHLISEKGMRPDQILAVTFTNKAAKEMRERVYHLLYDGAEYLDVMDTPMPMMKTFHGLAVYILRRHHELVGLPKTFQILDRSDSISLLKKVGRKRFWNSE